MECKHCNMKLVSPERDCSHSYLIIVFRVVGLFLVVCKDVYVMLAITKTRTQLLALYIV